MNTQSCKYSCKNRYLQILIHRGSTSACGEKFTVMTTRNVCGKQHGVWGAPKPCAMRADTSIDFPSLTRAFSTCSKNNLFEHPHYRKFTDTCGCNPILPGTLLSALESSTNAAPCCYGWQLKMRSPCNAPK